jgi:hypothetical protein
MLSHVGRVLGVFGLAQQSADSYDGPWRISRRAGVARRRRSNLFEPLESRMLLTALPALTIGGNSQGIAAGDATPSRVDFTDYAQINVGGTVTRQYTLTNSGQAALTFNGAAPVTFSGANAGDFQIVAQPTGSVGAGLSTNITVSFTPAAAGLRTAQLTVATNDPAHPQFTFGIDGTGLTTSTVAGATGLLIATTQPGTGVHPVVKGNALNVLYTGYLLDGTVFDASSLHNSVPFALTLGYSSVINGWQLGLPGAVVGESRTLIIPADLGYGSTAQPKIPANSTLIFETTVVSVDGPYLDLTGNGAIIAAGDATPSVADDTAFGNVAAGATVTHTFTITSSGTGTLRFLGTPRATLGGGNANQFSMTQPAVNQAGTAAEFTVSYTPTVHGSHTATITIPTNDPTNPNFSFTVGGSSLAAIHAAYDRSLVVPAGASAGNTFNVPLSIQNTGVATAAGLVNIQVRASQDATWDNSDVFLGSLLNFQLNLGGGGMTVANISATIPAATTLPGGNYYLLGRLTPVNAGDTDLASNVVATAGQALGVIADGPDLTVSLGGVSPGYPSYVPGDAIKIPVTITNTGNQPAAASVLQPIFVELRTSATSAFHVADPLFLPAIGFTKPLLPGASATVLVSVKLPLSFAAGTAFITAKVDPTNLVAERNESNNTTDGAVTSTSLPVSYSFGNIGRTRSVALTIRDLDGTKTTFKLTGPGSGSITVAGGTYQLTLRNTTAASSLTITTAKAIAAGDDGRFTLGSLSVGDVNTPASLGTLTAKTTDLRGGFALNGSAKAITLGSVDGGVAHAALAFAGNVATLTIAGALANVSLTAPSLGKVSIAGDLLNAQIQLTQPFASRVKSLASLSAGHISNSQLRALGNLGAITALTLDQSLIFAGVLDSVSTRPTAADFISNDPTQLPTLASLTLKGIASQPGGAVLTNSQVAAGTIPTIKLPNRPTAVAVIDPAGAFFGFTTRAAPAKSYTGPASLDNFISGKDALVS